MPDNVMLANMSGGAIVRSIMKSGFQSQVITIDLGGSGAESLLTGAMPVTGTFWQTTQPVSIASPVAVTQSGTWSDTVTQATASSLNATVVGTGTFAVQATQSGTWNIGTVTTLPSIPAGTNLIGQISASDETGTIYSGTTAVTPKFATFSTSSSGATTVIALVNGKRLRVLRWSCTANGATNIQWQSHVTPTNISGLKYMTQFKDSGGAYCPVGHFQTVSGEALDINNSNAIAISGEVTYIEV